MISSILIDELHNGVDVIEKVTANTYDKITVIHSVMNGMVKYHMVFCRKEEVWKIAFVLQ